MNSPSDKDRLGPLPDYERLSRPICENLRHLERLLEEYCDANGRQGRTLKMRRAREYQDRLRRTLGQVQRLGQALLCRQAEVREILSEDSVRPALPDFRHYVESQAKGRDRKFLQLRAKGLTLRQIADGESFNTLEEARQLVLQAFERAYDRFSFPKEESLLPCFLKYRFDRDSALAVLGIDDYSFIYLGYRNGTVSLGDKLDLLALAQDQDYSPEIRQRALDCAMRGRLLLDGEYIQPSRRGLVEHLLPRLCREKIDLGVFKGQYEDYVRRHHLDGRGSLRAGEESRDFAALVKNLPSVLCSVGNTIRYFELSDEGFQNLLTEIRFWEGGNLFLSTQYYFDRYPQVLEKYGLLDKFELHNLLRKRLGGSVGVAFSRTPHLAFGSGDPIAQLQALRNEFPDLNKLELSRIFQERYGVDSRCVQANYAKFVEGPGQEPPASKKVK